MGERSILFRVILLTLAIAPFSLWAAGEAGGSQLPDKGLMEQGIHAFQSQDYKWARESFEALHRRDPKNATASYYLGTLNLRDGDVPGAIHQWRRYMTLDPTGADNNGVPRRVTLLEDDARKGEIETILKNEAQLSKLPATANSIAVMGFVNKGDEKYNVLAKGLTALVITDLSQVPGLKVLEREKVQKLQEEIKLSESGLTAEESKVRTGRLLRAEKIMMGDFSIQEAVK